MQQIYHRSMISWLQDNDIEMYLTYNEGKSVVAERFIKTLKCKIYKYMTLISTNVYIERLDDIVNKYNNTSKQNQNEAKSSLLMSGQTHTFTLIKKYLGTC